MSTKKDPSTLPTEEGPRSFARLLEQIGEGDLEIELAAKMFELVAQCRGFADRYSREGKGTLTLVLNVAALGNGTVTVAGDIKTKTPTAKRAGSVFFLTAGGNLSVENPRQQKLPLREVPTGPRAAKDISADMPSRGV